MRNLTKLRVCGIMYLGGEEIWIRYARLVV